MVRPRPEAAFTELGTAPQRQKNCGSEGFFAGKNDRLRLHHNLPLGAMSSLKHQGPSTSALRGAQRRGNPFFSSWNMFEMGRCKERIATQSADWFAMTGNRTLFLFDDIALGGKCPGTRWGG